jgi:hypothetical protein
VVQGLDWQARKEVVEILAQLKKQCTLFVVSCRWFKCNQKVVLGLLMRYRFTAVCSDLHRFRYRHA